MTGMGDREVLAAVAEALIPPGHGGPSAREASVLEHIREVLDIRPDLAVPFASLMGEAVGQEPELWARVLLRERPSDFKLMTDVLVAAWLRAPEAREWLHWRPIADEFSDPDPIPAAELAGMMRQVSDRGPSYRATGWTPKGGA